jgi:hypothetical protein
MGPGDDPSSNDGARREASTPKARDSRIGFLSEADWRQDRVRVDEDRPLAWFTNHAPAGSGDAITEALSRCWGPAASLLG